MIQKLFFPLLTLSASLIYSQRSDEYIVKTTNDTVFALVKRLTLFGDGVVAEVNGEKRKILAEEISLVHFDGQDWLSIKDGNSFKLMRRVRKGEIDVFLLETKSRDGAAVTTIKYYYLRHESQGRGDVIALPERGRDSREWESILSALPCSCKEYMLKLLENEGLKSGSQKDYLELISTYNFGCKNGKVVAADPVFKKPLQSRLNIDSLKIKAGEQIYLTRSSDGKSWNAENEISDPSRTVILSLLIQKNSFAALQIKNQTNMKFKYKAFTYNFEKNAYVPSKVSAVKENVVYTESWPFSLDHILLTSFELK